MGVSNGRDTGLDVKIIGEWIKQDNDLVGGKILFTLVEEESPVVGA